MSHLEHVFHVWNLVYDKTQDAKTVIKNFFHEDYRQCINGVIMNRDEFIDHILEQKKNIDSLGFKCKVHLLELNKLFILYDAKGKNIQGEAIEAEVIAYVEFKDDKIFKIHGQRYLMKGNPSEMDMGG